MAFEEHGGCCMVPMVYFSSHIHFTSTVCHTCDSMIAVTCDLCHEVSSHEQSYNFLNVDSTFGSLFEVVKDFQIEEIIMDYKCNQ